MSGRAQVALKNNLLYDLSLTPNISLEVGLAPKWSFDVTYGINPWEFSGGKKWRHWLLQPEVRYWFCQKFNGHFLAVHGMGGEFNAGNVRFPFGILPELRNQRYEGWYAGGGVAYGYQWPITKHFSMEGEIGIGYDYIQYKRFDCGECGHSYGPDHTHYFGPTKLALNIIYVF